MFGALSLSSSQPVIAKQSVIKAKSSKRVFIQWQVTRGILLVKSFHAFHCAAAALVTGNITGTVTRTRLPRFISSVNRTTSWPLPTET